LRFQLLLASRQTKLALIITGTKVLPPKNIKSYLYGGSLKDFHSILAQIEFEQKVHKLS